MFESFGTISGVAAAMRSVAVPNGQCVACHKGRRTVYPWPAPGLGLRCAVCIVKESQENDA